MSIKMDTIILRDDESLIVGIGAEEAVVLSKDKEGYLKISGPMNCMKEDIVLTTSGMVKKGLRVNALVEDQKIHLCDTCTQCKGMPVFGDKATDDNVIICTAYKRETESAKVKCTDTHNAGAWTKEYIGKLLRGELCNHT